MERARKSEQSAAAAAQRPRAVNLNPLDMFKTNKKSVSLGLVVIGAFALLSTVVSVSLTQDSAKEEQTEENENAKSSFDSGDSFQ